ncbi:aromatic ring-hydroxylating dioxygenase subunit alpha [Burkholderia singularis]|uniref:aromatic ring-hydroxylating dioxygenase subunit alpha n=1 Tax=Burkholderia singularis TaxID=1503053 RepID=UPI000B76E2A5|nr:aromatic ring-hydroxylating dioxygenase subunit alpha [Burkholderia singularis]
MRRAIPFNHEGVQVFVRNQWYVAGLSSEIGATPFPRTIANEKIVFYRTANGDLIALPNRCPHRQVPLSEGCVVDDHIQCGYHGMKFSSAGRCVSIPSQSIVPERAHLKPYRVADAHGFAWIWIGDSEPASFSAPDEFSVCSSEQYAGEMLYAHAKTDYRLGIDNFLDASHVLFVHPWTVASAAVTAAQTELFVTDDEVRVRRTMPNEACSPMFKSMLKVDFIDRIQDAVFRPISHTWIDTTITLCGVENSPMMKTRTFGLFTPETESTCHLFAGLYRNFEIGNRQLSELTAQQIKKTIDEDIYICEQVQSNWDDDYPIVHFGVDQACLAARRMIKNRAQPADIQQAARQATSTFSQIESAVAQIR